MDQKGTITFEEVKTMYNQNVKLEVILAVRSPIQVVIGNQKYAVTGVSKSDFLEQICAPAEKEANL